MGILKGVFSADSKRLYDGASKAKKFKKWRAPSTSANTELEVGLQTLRNRSRDLRRNNAYAKKAVSAITNNTIGRGIKTQFLNDGIDGEAGPLEQKWKEWAHSTAIDYHGRMNLFQMQRHIMDAVVESGEVIVRRIFDKNLPFPVQYQIIESDFLDDTKKEFFEKTLGHKIHQGVQFTKKGKREGYWLYETHPGGVDSFMGMSNNPVSRFHKAENVMHLFNPERPGQIRGIPWSSAVITKLKDTDEMQTAQIVRQKIAACVTAFVRDISADSVDFDDDCEDDIGETLEPGRIEFLPNGKTVEFVNPPSVDNYHEFNSVTLHAIASGYGISYEVLTGDLKEVNFSSARMGWLEFHRQVEVWRDDIILNGFLNPITKDFLNVCSLLGVGNSKAVAKHIAPRREMIDPTKEVPAIIKSVRAGLTTLSEEVSALGRDANEQIQEIAKERETFKKLGLILDSDPSTTTGQGAFQIEPSEPSEPQGGTDNE